MFRHMAGRMLIKRVIGLPQGFRYRGWSCERTLLVEDYILILQRKTMAQACPRARIRVGDNRNHSQDSAHAHIASRSTPPGQGVRQCWPFTGARMQDPAYLEPAEADQAQSGVLTGRAVTERLDGRPHLGPVLYSKPGRGVDDGPKLVSDTWPKLSARSAEHETDRRGDEI